MTALSGEAYHAAQAHNLLLQNWLCNDRLILRQGEIHTISTGSLPINGRGTADPHKYFRYRLNMFEPVLQGYADAEVTRFILTLASDDLSSHEQESVAEGDSESDRENIEIDESFLASSVLPSIQSPSFNPEVPVCSVDGHISSTGGRSDEVSTSSGARFWMKPLSEPISPMQDGCTMYLRTADLGRVGILNGDWVSKSPEGFQTEADKTCIGSCSFM